VGKIFNSPTELSFGMFPLRKGVRVRVHKHSPQGSELCGIGGREPPKPANKAGSIKPQLNAGNPTLKGGVAHKFVKTV
jgi:hypothetical protein